VVFQTGNYLAFVFASTFVIELIYFNNDITLTIKTIAEEIE